jgi:thioredoxin reductase (NADPH)
MLEFVIYIAVAIIIFGIIGGYLYFHNVKSNIVSKKIETAKLLKIHEPVSLHPVIDYNICIGSGACVSACPEQDIIGLVHNKGTLVNASRCIGHGACFHSCPVEAISLVMGTEKRGIELPHINKNYETNVKGIYITGELGGMGLIKNAVEQAKMAIQYIAKDLDKSQKTDFDVFIIGGGPAGIAASLMAKKLNLSFRTVDQDSVGGSVFTFPRSKIVMTSPMELPLHGKVKFRETNKTELLGLWEKVLEDNSIKINEKEKVLSIENSKSYFKISTSNSTYTSKKVLLAIGRRGSPRKLGVDGEKSEKVSYRLLEPELIKNKNILVLGGGDSAVESAMLLADGTNNVTISYRASSFSRVKEANYDKINFAISSNKIQALYNSNVKSIEDDKVVLQVRGQEQIVELPNDLVYIFIGGELPNQFLKDSGINITKRFGEVVLKH